MGDDIVERTVRLRRMGPADGKTRVPCAACKQAFKAGEWMTLIALGPSSDPDSQARCREGRAYNAVCAVVHWACATGITEEVEP